MAAPRRKASWERTLVLAAAAIAVLLARHFFRRVELPRPGGREPEPILTARVAQVIDGDTVLLEDGREVRYAGIDAPEFDQPMGPEARRRNEDLVLGKTVELRPAGAEVTDRYGRMLAVVSVSGSSEGSVNAELVREGLACVYQALPESLEPGFGAELLAAQSEALSNRRGLWKEQLARAAAVEGRLVATRLRIHRRGCPELEHAKGRPVRSVEAELREGKSFCRTCRPVGD